MFLRASLALFSIAILCAGCTTVPEQSSDVESYSRKIYRTGSNLPVKDYGAENFDIAPPDIINPVNRPMGAPKPRGGG
jgi:hypothetical protein